LVGDVLVGTQEFIARRTGAVMSHEEWRRIVGAKVAGRSRVGGLSRGTLTIKVASSAWSNELSFLRADIIERLALAGYEVSALRFRVDPNPFQEKAAPVRRFGPQPQKQDLPPELEDRLSRIEDPNLRAAIREAASWSLGAAAPWSAPTGASPAGASPGKQATALPRFPARPKRS
jgi:hypothetical protein